MTKPRRGTKANPFEIGEKVKLKGFTATGTIVAISKDAGQGLPGEHNPIFYDVEWSKDRVSTCGIRELEALNEKPPSNLKVLPAPPSENKRLAGLLREDADRLESDRPIKSYALVAVYEDGGVGTIYEGDWLRLMGATEILRDRLVRDFSK
jgi:hypothetical protein